MPQDKDLYGKMESDSHSIYNYAGDGRPIGIGLVVLAYGLLLGCRIIARAIAHQRIDPVPGSMSE